MSLAISQYELVHTYKLYMQYIHSNVCIDIYNGVSIEIQIRRFIMDGYILFHGKLNNHLIECHELQLLKNAISTTQA